MKRTLIFSLLAGMLILVSGTLSYFYDSEVQRGYFTSGHWASEIYPVESFVLKESDVRIVFEGEEGIRYEYDVIFRIVDAPGVPELDWDGENFVEFNLKKDLNDWIVGMVIQPHANGTYNGILKISYPSYPYKVLEIPVTITLEE
ncbi:MAG: hypothetical protein H0Z19_06275 [Archaeoglobus sp.]|uniref:SipW-dependent-type signal peptide-containing protein n=1 Tax=Archaeoglobus sp. TaxID=1872626 RepID=UPI001D79F52D|nr:SipW-dependent-type signal peptide-containing protein [Archaeoglobus sp.]MBO8180072.1 hypothetical protein [Archaeoglobus sp.]